MRTDKKRAVKNSFKYVNGKKRKTIGNKKYDLCKNKVLELI